MTFFHSLWFFTDFPNSELREIISNNKVIIGQNSVWRRCYRKLLIFTLWNSFSLVFYLHRQLHLTIYSSVSLITCSNLLSTFNHSAIHSHCSYTHTKPLIYTGTVISFPSPPNTLHHLSSSLFLLDVLGIPVLRFTLVPYAYQTSHTMYRYCYYFSISS